MIREAAIEDIDMMVSLGKSFHEEAPVKLPFDPVVFSTFVSNFILGEDKLAIVQEGAMFLGQESQYPAANGLQANEILWYAKPDARGTGALKMIDHFENWAKEKGCIVVFVGAYQNSAGPLYERKGYKMIDTNWAKEIV